MCLPFASVFYNAVVRNLNGIALMDVNYEVEKHLEIEVNYYVDY